MGEVYFKKVVYNSFFTILYYTLYNFYQRKTNYSLSLSDVDYTYFVYFVLRAYPVSKFWHRIVFIKKSEKERNGEREKKKGEREGKRIRR